MTWTQLIVFFVFVALMQTAVVLAILHIVLPNFKKTVLRDAGIPESKDSEREEAKEEARQAIREKITRPYIQKRGSLEEEAASDLEERALELVKAGKPYLKRGAR